MAPHECTPSCIVCGGGHLTGSQDCKAKFRRLQQPGNPTGQRTQPRTAVPSGPVTTSKAPTPSNKTTKGTTGPAPPAGTLPGVPPSLLGQLPRKRHGIQTSLHSKTGFPGSPGPPSGAPKNTSQPKVGSRDGPPPPPRTPLPSPPPKLPPPHPPLNSDVADLRRELETLRAQNAQLNAKIHALETARPPRPPAQVAPEPMQVVPADPTPSSSDLRFTALENALAD
ncbi:WAS/WASL-interacting protein family member 2 [Dermacentor silvarum]|uniref:WAS/WASL-interacting protein family member 2 n=1 Tax=Dermacentor silvarum TaxID=543639 RepID=UPI00189B737B|nr:WAS/WASL-interacting protein family member 2 [Dermacentor silvarum]